MRKDIFSNIKATQVTVAAVQTSTVTSAEVDVAGYESLAFIYDIGNSGDTLSGSLKWTLSLVESDTSGGSFTAVAAADMQVQGGTFGTDSSYVIDAAAEDSLAVKIGYIGSKRYVKALATATGSHSTGTPIGIIALQSHASTAPVA